MAGAGDGLSTIQSVLSWIVLIEERATVCVCACMGYKIPLRRGFIYEMEGSVVVAPTA